MNPTWLRARLNPTRLRAYVNPTRLRAHRNPTWLRARLRNEDGSISVLVFGLFAVVLLSGVVLTDFSAVIVAQRSLVQATESAAQSAAHALDLDTYYQGKHSALSFLVSDASPVIPIDCKAASSRASETLADIANTSNRNYGGSNHRSDDSSNSSNWSDRLFGGSNKEVLRRELSDVRISEFQCNGTEVLITASAKAWLPISLSLFSFESVELSASAGTTSVKKRVLSIFGINL
jgi:hypothetical protein